MLHKRHLFKYALLALPLAFAGLPIYVNVPKFYTEIMHLKLASIGAIIFAIRLCDTFIDPFIGMASDRLRAHRFAIVMGSALLLAFSYFLLFSPPEFASGFSLLWLATCLVLVYLSFSTLMINYYAYGLEISDSAAANIRISAWREGFMLLGVLCACILPTLLMQHYPMKTAYVLFTLLSAPLILLAAYCTFCDYKPLAATPHTSHSFYYLLRDKSIRNILLLAFFNAIPSAITSTLFLFFVADILHAGAQSGFMLAAYFLSSALGTLLWSAIAKRIGKRNALLNAMLLAIISFIWAWQLGENDSISFYSICILSGLTMAADVVLLPALFADALGNNNAQGATAFGLWNLVSKLSIAFAAGLVLPLLSFYGYESGKMNNASALTVLSFCYALLPCFFKAGAAFYLYISSIDKGVGHGVH